MPKRCKWVISNSPISIKYHDEEWGKFVKDDGLLWEYLVLECFQSGLSWNCVLKKREYLRLAFRNFNPGKIALYRDKEINNLLNNRNIIRHKGKIIATINNARLFIDISNEYHGFYNYLKSYFNAKNNIFVSNLTKDLKKKGFKFIGESVIMSYLQAIGLIKAHEENCFMNSMKE